MSYFTKSGYQQIGNTPQQHFSNSSLQSHLRAHVQSECAYKNSQHDDHLELISKETMPSLVISVVDQAKMVNLLNTYCNSVVHNLLSYIDQVFQYCCFRTCVFNVTVAER